MSGIFPDPAYDGPPPTGPRGPQPTARPQRRRALIGTAAILVLLFFLSSVFTGVWTDKLWFSSVGYSEVFTTVLGTKVLLFAVFGLLFGGLVAANIYVAYRFQPTFRPLPAERQLAQYREVVEPIRRIMVIGVGGMLGLIAGSSASGQWRTFLMWKNREPFGAKDAYFKKDIGFFVFSLPWFHYVVNFALMVIVLALIAAVITHYLFGGIRLQARGNRLSDPARIQITVLLGLFVLVKAADYWLDRYDLTIDQGRRFTGINFTAFNATLPAKNILMFIALICAVLFFAGVVRRTWLLPSVGLGLLVLSAILLGAVWPGVVWQFQVRPSEPDKEETFLARNIEATRTAYDVEGVQEQDYEASVNVKADQLKASAELLPGIRLIDPARMSEAFNQLQQVRGYYSVASELDVDRYEINGQVRDIVLGVRELDQSGLVSDQRNWANQHTVYTHGYGVIAAFGNNKTAQSTTPTTGEPPWAEEDLPPKGDLSDLTEDGYEGRIYFGEKSPTYSIVGKVRSDARDVELDIPEEVAGVRGNTTYDGSDGVGVGNLFRKMLYAVKYGEPNIVLSSRVNENSKIVYERHPRERVEKVAPWLTVDGDPYPAVVDGRVLWILDGYTTTDRYPNSERASFEEMISDALTPTTSYVTLPTDHINYIRNSVKATVDAYDGTVTLYQWQDDPILEVWKKVFPGIVQEEIPETLKEHVRYPEDMFKVQRHILADYHVTRPQDFYKGTDLWDVPEDASDPTSKQPPYRLSVQMPAPGKTTLAEDTAGTDESGSSDASNDASPSTAASTDPVFSLTSVFTPKNRNNLASFIAANSDATSPDYGTIRILRLPDESTVQGPSQIANTFAADERIQTKLLPIRQNSQVKYGNLLTLPVGGGLLYVQPVYALRESGQGTYPVLRFVLASFGKDAGYGTSLTEALQDVLRKTDTGTIDLPDDTPDTTPDKPGKPNKPGTGSTDAQVLDLLRQADAKFAAAEAALKRGDTVGWARSTKQAQSLVREALAAAQAGR